MTTICGGFAELVVGLPRVALLKAAGSKEVLRQMLADVAHVARLGQSVAERLDRDG